MPEIGIVKLGGAFTACYEMGLPTALWERGYQVKMYQGVSAGALNAAKIVEQNGDPAGLRKIWINHIQQNGPGAIFRGGLFGSILARREYIYSSDGVDEIINKFIDIDKVLASPIILEIVAWNRRKRRIELFTTKEAALPEGAKITSEKNKEGFYNTKEIELPSGSKIIRHLISDPWILRRAVKASASLPWFFQPVDIFGDGELYTDGYSMELETLSENCDLIFVLVNDQVTLSSGPDDDGYSRKMMRLLFTGFRDNLDEVIDTKIELFQARHKNFNTKIDSPIDLLKKIWREFTGANKRLVVLSPFGEIPSLQFDQFKYDKYKPEAGDIYKMGEYSIIQARRVLDELGLESRLK